MKTLLVPTLCCVLFTASSSLAFAKQPSYSFIQASIVKSEVSGLERFNPGGYEFTVSAELGYNIFAEYEYRDVSDTFDGIKLNTSNEQFSLGYIHNVSARITFDYRVGYGDFELKGSSATESSRASTDYFSVAGNVRYQLSPELEVFAGLEAQDWDLPGDQKAYRLGAHYDLFGFIAGLKYTKYSDQEVFAASLRYAF